MVAVAASLLIPLLGCEDKFSAGNYDKIQNGMQLYEVEKIMGGKGEQQETKGTDISAGGIASGSKGSSQAVYEWTHGTKLVTVTVKDGKVVDHNKSGF